MAKVFDDFDLDIQKVSSVEVFNDAVSTTILVSAVFSCILTCEGCITRFPQSWCLC